MFRLEGKTALITGASKGIGREIARTFAASGAGVGAGGAQPSRSSKPWRRKSAKPAARPGPWPSTYPSRSLWAEQLAALPEEVGDLDIVVNNAGITRDGLFARMSVEQFRGGVARHLVGAFAVSRELLRGMMRKRWGRILFISSVVGLMGNPGQANYAASKAGLVGMSKSLAKEIGSRNITVNVVAPGFIETAMTMLWAIGSRSNSPRPSCCAASVRPRTSPPLLFFWPARRRATSPARYSTSPGELYI